MTTIKFSGKQEKVKLNELITDGRFNRQISQGWVDRLIADFRESAFGNIIVSRRRNGEQVILDGQHRVVALRELGFPEDRALIPAVVYSNLSVAEEAYLFKILNDQQQVSALQKYRALLTAGDPDICLIDKIVRGFSLRVHDDYGDYVIQSVTTLERIYRMSEQRGTLLRNTLATITWAWGGLRDALRGQILNGVARYLYEHPDTKPEMLAEKLANVGGGPMGLIGRGRVVKGPTGSMSLAEAISHVIEKEVMRGRRRKLKSA